MMCEAFALTDEHRQIIGKEFSRLNQHVTRDMLIAYAKITGTTHALYTNVEVAQALGYRDIIAMPTFVTADAASPLVPPEIPFRGGGLNAGYECTFHGDIYPGDTLTYTTCIADLYAKTGRSGTLYFKSSCIIILILSGIEHDVCVASAHFPEREI